MTTYVVNIIVAVTDIFSITTLEVDNNTETYITIKSITTMKKVLISLLSTAMLGFVSCGTTRNAIQATKSEMESPYGKSVELTVCERMAEEKPGLRASGKGVSYNESSARQIAELEARAQMSRALETAIINAAKSANVDITQFAGGDRDGMSATDAGGKQNMLTEIISSNIIGGANVIKTEKFYDSNRKYTIFVCLEYNGTLQEMAHRTYEQVRQRVSDEDRAKIDKENEKFEEEVKQFMMKK